MSVTVVPESKASTQSAPHAIPPGLLVTALVGAVPALVTVNTGAAPIWPLIRLRD